MIVPFGMKPGGGGDDDGTKVQKRDPSEEDKDEAETKTNRKRVAVG